MDLTKENFRSEYIHGDRFHALADFSLTADYPIISSEVFERDGTIFCNGDFLLGLFKALQKSTRKYILITHNSDLNITEEVYAQKPDSIKFWFAQNVCVKRDDLQPLPIGLEREQCIEHRNIEDTTYSTFCKVNTDIPNHKLVYLNINHRTNRREREPIRNSLSWRWWVTSKKKRTHEEYLDDILQSKFTLSPPGNGEDCHRTWEALYLGSIPIVKKSVMTEYFSQFFSMFLYESSSDISRKKLLDLYKKTDLNNSYETLTFSYWKSVILNKKKELLHEGN